ncbi:hypothetical protein [Francisella orientalis]|uniref:Uncharacterized protein n=1 Tax=Francisella orientalis TaxID=299583 RepID=A0AAP7FUA4_9GAMM|nr:hypothetical protein [Francisella orientalis]AFJ43201.1 hypothetical protein OOM_0708 [Francisella orientalis str. Toba 04]AKN86136.1 hypothetical protein FNO12_1603 [Francisella orientalis FNO12]AKN87674.1 Hypothetical protein FNO24_1605 [Francisella orientalis FNO24]AKN89212.1 Hypothetical protein FNO190_1603 [Francisella orientalis]AKU05971.1 Hypothetical protein FNO01_1603 [Francisella orientalis]
MKKPSFDLKKRPHDSGSYQFENSYKSLNTEEFSLDKPKQFPAELVEIFNLIQAVRYDRIALQEEYNKCRLKLNNDRMDLEFEIIKIKKHYNARISALQEEYNSVKSNYSIELTKIRES